MSGEGDSVEFWEGTFQDELGGRCSAARERFVRGVVATGFCHSGSSRLADTGRGQNLCRTPHHPFVALGCRWSTLLRTPPSLELQRVEL